LIAQYWAIIGETSGERGGLSSKGCSGLTAPL
jgi:hypothetical protein